MIGAIALLLIVSTIVWLVSHEAGAEFRSPENPNFRALFIENGRLGFYVGVSNNSPVLIESFGLFPYQQLSRGQWTKDGGMFVCTISDPDEIYSAAAYDFTSHEKFVSHRLGKTNEVSNAFDTVLLNRVTSHGGLDSEIIDHQKIRDSFQSRIWHENVPP